MKKDAVGCHNVEAEEFLLTSEAHLLTPPLRRQVQNGCVEG